MNRFYDIKENTKAEVKDIDTTGRTISVYYSAFDNKDRDGDVIVKGAYTKTIKEQGPSGVGEIWHLINHKTEDHIARPFELTEDGYGLLSRVKLPNTTKGNDTLELYKENHYRHHSIGYKSMKNQKKPDYNEITEIKLFEGSSVLWAANPNAITVGVKSLFQSRDDLVAEMNLTIKSLRNGKYTDETFSLLEIKLRQLQQAFVDLTDTTQPAVAVEPDKKENGLLVNRLKSINQLLNNERWTKINKIAGLMPN